MGFRMQKKRQRALNPYTGHSFFVTVLLAFGGSLRQKNQLGMGLLHRGCNIIEQRIKVEVD